MPLVATRGNAGVFGLGWGAPAGGGAAAMTAIAATTTSGTVTSVSFTSIPGTYDDLYLVAYSLSPYGGLLGFRFNNISTTTYSYLEMVGNGSSASIGATTGTTYGQGGFVSDLQYSANVMHILNYANTSTYKTALIRGGADQNGSVGADYGKTALSVSLWRSTSAITRLDIFTVSGNSNQSISTGSIFALYGIKKAA